MTNDLVFVDPIEKPPCPDCKGTGKIVLFTGIVDCEACKPKEEDYVVYDWSKLFDDWWHELYAPGGLPNEQHHR